MWRVRRAAVRLLGGRRPRPAAAPRRGAVRAGAGRSRRPRALGDARIGVGRQELPDGIRPRLRAAQVGRRRGCTRRGRAFARGRDLRRAARGRPDAGRDPGPGRGLARRRLRAAPSVPGCGSRGVAPLDRGRASTAHEPAPSPAARNRRPHDGPPRRGRRLVPLPGPPQRLPDEHPRARSGGDDDLGRRQRFKRRHGGARGRAVHGRPPDHERPEPRIRGGHEHRHP